jgi:hypothetical protein
MAREGRRRRRRESGRGDILEGEEGERMGRKGYFGHMSVDRMMRSDRDNGQFCTNLFEVLILDLRTWSSGVISRHSTTE